MNYNHLIYWLQKKNDIASSLNYNEYSNYYKNWFGIDFTEEDFVYKHDDIDYIAGQITKNDNREFTDLVNIDNQTLCLHIPPKTNQSNANCLYKIILNESLKISEYDIPLVQKNPKLQYKGNRQQIYFELDKTEFYEYLRKRS